MERRSFISNHTTSAPEGRDTNTCTVDVDMTADDDSYTHSYRDVTTMAYGLVLGGRLLAYGSEVKLHPAYGLTSTVNAVKAVA